MARQRVRGKRASAPTVNRCTRPRSSAVRARRAIGVSAVLRLVGVWYRGSRSGAPRVWQSPRRTTSMVPILSHVCLQKCEFRALVR
jgi:hypothetical protein